MLDTQTNVRFIYKERSYIKTLRTTIALLSKYARCNLRTFSMSTLTLCFVSFLPFLAWEWAISSAKTTLFILFFLIFIPLFVIVNFRGKYYAYIKHYLSYNTMPKSLSELSSRVVSQSVVRVVVVNVVFRLPYVVGLTLLLNRIAEIQSLLGIVGIILFFIIVSIYLHVVAVVLEFYYVFEQRPLTQALMLAFKRGGKHWGSLFLVSFFAELAAVVIALSVAAPFVVVMLSLDNAYTLEYISQEIQQVPWLAYVLAVVTGTIALAGALGASIFPLWANTLQCGSMTQRYNATRTTQS